MWADQPVREWIDSVCRQFSRATGWPLVFDGLQASASPATACSPSDYQGQWRSAIGNGTETVGTLRLGRQEHQQRDESYLQACELADLTALLIERVLTEQAAGESLRVSDRPSPVSNSQGSVAVTVEQAEGSPTEPHSSPYVDRVLRMAMRLSGFPAAALFVHELGTDCLRLRAERAPDGMTIPQPTRRLDESCIDAECLEGGLRAVRRSVDSRTDVLWLPDEAATGICQGIVVAGKPRGTLWMFDRRDRRLKLRDRHVIESVASRLGELIERAVLLDESTRSRRLRVELQIAARTQPPAEIRHVGTDGWCELAGHTQSSEEVGGDLFEVIPLSDDRLFVAVGDAVGHSIPAAMVMASVRGAIRALVDDTRHDEYVVPTPSPHEVLRRVNSVLHGIVQAHQFMTMFCAIIDRRHLRMEYANAGHPPPLLIRDDERQSLESHGLVLGALEDTVYDRTVVPLRPGDLLALYTDGLSEAMDANQAMFGTEEMADIAVRHCHEGAAVIRDRVWESLQMHLSQRSPEDDRTLAVLRINEGLCSPRRHDVCSLQAQG